MNLGESDSRIGCGTDLRGSDKAGLGGNKLQMFSEKPLFAKTVGAFRKEGK